MASSSEGDPAADAELRALLGQLKQTRGLSYEKLAAAAHMSRGTAQQYVTRAGHRRDIRTLEQLLTALGASGPARDPIASPLIAAKCG